MSQAFSTHETILDTSDCKTKPSDSPPTYLADISTKDRPWDSHKLNSKIVQSYYESADFINYKNRISECSNLLGFGLTLAEDSTLALRLRSARFCRLRFCPVCQWRRSLMWKSKAHKIIPLISEKYPNYRWIFLTLTVRTCEITELKTTLSDMGKSYQRLIQRKSWPAVGWIRSVEVTRSSSGKAHPHYHCLLLVKPSYFSKGYIKHDEWVELWKDAARLDYTPIVDIRRVGSRKPIDTVIPEILKYTTKESDLIDDENFFIELTRQMHRVRCVATGGLLKEYLKVLEEDPDDLIGEDSEEDAEDGFGDLCFSWENNKSKYRMVDV